MIVSSEANSRLFDVLLAISFDPVNVFCIFTKPSRGGPKRRAHANYTNPYFKKLLNRHGEFKVCLKILGIHSEKYVKI